MELSAQHVRGAVRATSTAVLYGVFYIRNRRYGGYGERGRADGELLGAALLGRERASTGAGEAVMGVEEGG